MNQIRLSTSSGGGESEANGEQYCTSKCLVLLEEECFFISFRKALFNWYAFLCASAEKEKQGKHNLHQGSTLNQHLVTTHFQLESCKWNLQITNKLPICWRINDIELINAIRSKRGVLIQLAIGQSFVLDEFRRLIEAPASERLSFFDNSLVCILATSYKWKKLEYNWLT